MEISMIILNEKKYVTNILENKNVDVSEIYTFLSIYARYLYQEQGLRKNEITLKLNAFMETYYPGYNPVEWTAFLEKYTSRANIYPLCQCDGIWITGNELQKIESLHNKVLERLSFTLLCLAKFANYRNPCNNNWIHYSNGEIYTMACINASSFEKDAKINQLRELGLVDFAKKIDNLGIRVLFIDDSGEKKLFISDFRRLGYEWRLYKEEKYIRCAHCGILVKNTNGRRLYCRECSETIDKEKARKRMKKLRVS